MDIKAALRSMMQAVVLFGAGLIVPVAGQFVSLFTPVPLILATVRSGWKEGTAATLVATTIVTALAGWQAGLMLFGGFGLMAAGTGTAMRLRARAETAVLLGGGMPVAAAAVVLAIYAARTGVHPVAAAETYLHASVHEAIGIYTRMGLAELAAVVSSMEDTFVHYTVRLLPGIALATSCVQAACCLGMVKIILQRGKRDAMLLPEDQSLARWHAPDVWVWGVIAALGCMAMPQETVKFIGMNIAIVYLVVYTAQGMAVVEFALRRFGMHSVLRGVLHAVILALPSVMFLPPLGIVDIWADFRKVRTAAVPPSPDRHL